MRVAFVPIWMTVTVAPVIDAPLGSVTVPVIDPVMPWLNEVCANAIASRNAKPAVRLERQMNLISPDLHFCKVAFGISSNRIFIFSFFTFLGIRTHAKAACASDLVALSIGGHRIPR